MNGFVMNNEKMNDSNESNDDDTKTTKAPQQLKLYQDYYDEMITCM